MEAKSIYWKAASYINAQGTDTYATLCGTDNQVYVSTDLGGMRIHEEEVKAYASLYDTENTQA